jgi:hypothetical protein
VEAYDDSADGEAVAGRETPGKTADAALSRSLTVAGEAEGKEPGDVSAHDRPRWNFGQTVERDISAAAELPGVRLTALGTLEHSNNHRMS